MLIGMDLFAIAVSGALAGLAVAMPLGAIGLLLVQEGIARGWARGIPAALAVATVDTLYCAVAIVAGALAAPAATALAPWPQVVGGLVLAGIGGHGLRAALRRTGRITTGGFVGRRRYLLFLGLTAINPATLLYFAAVITALGETTASPTIAVVFVLAVGLSSLSWQLLLVTVGAILRKGAPPLLERLTPIIGNTAIVLVGATVTVSALLSSFGE